MEGDIQRCSRGIFYILYTVKMGIGSILVNQKIILTYFFALIYILNLHRLLLLEYFPYDNSEKYFSCPY